MTLSDAEYRALRDTISTRGTVRIALLLTAVCVWASLETVVLLFAQIPAAALLPLAVLAAGFEAIRALHIGVERIGRYLQVFYEEATSDRTMNGARWETTAMATGPSLPGGGVDPLFTMLFACAVILNFGAALLPGPTLIEGGLLGALHVAFMVRIVRTRMAAGTQRVTDLQHYRRLRDTPTQERSS